MNFLKNYYHFINIKLKKRLIHSMSSYFCSYNIKLDKIDCLKYPLKKLLKDKLALEDYLEACELMDELCHMAQMNGFKTKAEIIEAMHKWECK